MSLPWLSDPRRPLTSPREIPKLEAWFDALDTRTMLSGDGATITDGGAVALWGDKSGNSGVNCLVLPGVSGNYAGIPNPASGGIRITGNIDIRTNASMPSWAPSSSSWFVTKMLTDGQSCYDFGTQGSSSDKLVFRYTPTGAFSAIRTAVSTVGTGFSAYTKNWVRATYNSSTGSVVFYTSIDGSAWTQLGDPVALTAGLIFDGSNALQIGQGTSTYLTGQIYRVQIYASLNGTDQRLDIDFSTAAKKLANGDKFTCATGQEVTLNSSGATGARIAGERDLFQGTLANRPVYLAYAGTKYGWNNATNANTFTTPDSAAVSITGDIDIRCRLALAAWTTGSASQDIVTRWETSNQSYLFRVNSTGTLRFITTADGSTAVNAESTAAVSYAANEAGWIRVTRDVDNGAGGNTTRFYTSSDGDTWVQLGNPVVVASTTSIFDGTAVLRISGNALATDTGINGKIYRAQIYNGIGGTLVADFNPALYTSGTTFTASTGEVWTVNGGAHIVTRTGLYFNGTSHHLGSAQYRLSQPETAYLTGSQITNTVSDSLLEGGANGTLRISQTGTTSEVLINAGASVGNLTPGIRTTSTLAGVFNGASSSFRNNRGTALTGNAGSGTPNGVTLGAQPTPTNYANMFVCEVAIYSAAHGTATQDRMALYAGRRHGFAV